MDEESKVRMLGQRQPAEKGDLAPGCGGGPNTETVRDILTKTLVSVLKSQCSTYKYYKLGRHGSKVWLITSAVKQTLLSLWSNSFIESLTHCLLEKYSYFLTFSYIFSH